MPSRRHPLDTFLSIVSSDKLFLSQNWSVGKETLTYLEPVLFSLVVWSRRSLLYSVAIRLHLLVSQTIFVLVLIIPQCWLIQQFLLAKVFYLFEVSQQTLSLKLLSGLIEVLVPPLVLVK